MAWPTWIGSRDVGSCQSSSLFLCPLAIFLSFCRSVQSLLAGLLSVSCFPRAQDWLSFSLRPVNHPEESLTAAGDGPQCPAAFSLAGGCKVLPTVPRAWLVAAGGSLGGLGQWDGAAAELGSVGLGPGKFPRSQLCQEPGQRPS